MSSATASGAGEKGAVASSWSSLCRRIVAKFFPRPSPLAVRPGNAEHFPAGYLIGPCGGRPWRQASSPYVSAHNFCLGGSRQACAGIIAGKRSVKRQTSAFAAFAVATFPRTVTGFDRDTTSSPAGLAQRKQPCRTTTASRATGPRRTTSSSSPRRTRRASRAPRRLRRRGTAGMGRRRRRRTAALSGGGWGTRAG